MEYAIRNGYSSFAYTDICWTHCLVPGVAAGVGEDQRLGIKLSNPRKTSVIYTRCVTSHHYALSRTGLATVRARRGDEW